MNHTLLPQDLFASPTEVGASRGELLFVIEIPGRLPSWNDILGMEQWARYKFKQELADAFLSALRRSEGDCSTKIISARSTTLTYADTLARYLQMKQQERRSRLLKKKLAAKNRSLSESKSSNGKIPF